MYRKHNWLLIALSACSFAIAYYFNFSYEAIAESAISIVSIVLAVYISVAAALLGSTYAGRMKGTVDVFDRTQSELGVLTQYLRYAGMCGVATLVISVSYIVPGTLDDMFGDVVRKCLASFAFSVFGCNIVFLWLIFVFLTNSLLKSVKAEQ